MRKALREGRLLFLAVREADGGSSRSSATNLRMIWCEDEGSLRTSWLDRSRGNGPDHHFLCNDVSMCSGDAPIVVQFSQDRRQNGICNHAIWKPVGEGNSRQAISAVCIDKVSDALCGKIMVRKPACAGYRSLVSILRQRRPRSRKIPLGFAVGRNDGSS